MTAPGTILKDIESNVPTTPSVDVARTFACGLSERGAVGVAVQATTLEAFEANQGPAVSYGYSHDAAQWLPVMGSFDNWFSRVVGPSAKQASGKLVDGTSTNTLEVLAANAKGDVDPGAWGNSLKAKVTLAGSVVTLEVLLGANVVETFAGSRAEVLLATKASAYIRLKELGGGDPKTQEITLTGGTDDRASITLAQWEAATNAFIPELGPGQLIWPGQTTKVARVAMMEAAKARNRVVVPDAVDTRTKATHLSAAEEWASIDKALRRCSFLPFGPWVQVPVAEGVLKTLPPSIFVAGRMAAHDGETFDPIRGVNNPNDPAAGKNGILEPVLGLSQEAWTDNERDELKTAINVIRWVYGAARIYGYRSMTNPLTDPVYKFGSVRRIVMAIKAKGQIAGEEAVFGQIDSKGHKLGDLESALKGVCQPYCDLPEPALFDLPGQPGSAYSVDVSEGVNPIEQLFEGKARAVVKLRPAPIAETIEVDFMVEGVS